VCQLKLTDSPTSKPTIHPTNKPSAVKLTKSPTSKPTIHLTNKPSAVKLTKSPTSKPTIHPTNKPSSVKLTKSPTSKPTIHLTNKPSAGSRIIPPTTSPASKWTIHPTSKPSTGKTIVQATDHPQEPTAQPAVKATVRIGANGEHTAYITKIPTVNPAYHEHITIQISLKMASSFFQNTESVAAFEESFVQAFAASFPGILPSQITVTISFVSATGEVTTLPDIQSYKKAQLADSHHYIRHLDESPLVTNILVYVTSLNPVQKANLQNAVVSASSHFNATAILISALQSGGLSETTIGSILQTFNIAVLSEPATPSLGPTQKPNNPPTQKPNNPPTQKPNNPPTQKPNTPTQIVTNPTPIPTTAPQQKLEPKLQEATKKTSVAGSSSVSFASLFVSFICLWHLIGL